VRRADDRVRITAQLIGTGDGYHLWSESFDRRLEDVFATQAEIAQKLVHALRVSLSREERETDRAPRTSSAEAYDHYLRGSTCCASTATAPCSSRRHVPRAIEHDAGSLWPTRARQRARDQGQWRLDMTPVDFEEAMAASRRALDSEPRLAEAIVASAGLLSMQGRAAEAEQSFEEALRVNPASYEAHFFYGRHCVGTGDVARRRASSSRGALEPADYQARCLLVTELDKLGRPTRRAPWGWRRCRSSTGACDTTPRCPALQLVRSWPCARRRRRARNSCSGRWSRRGTRSPPSTTRPARTPCSAIVSRRWPCSTGHHARSRNLGWIEHDSDLDSLRGEPRFEAILDRLRSWRVSELNRAHPLPCGVLACSWSPSRSSPPHRTHDRLTWFSRCCPCWIATPAAGHHWRRFPLTPLLYWLIAITR